ncbi:acetate/propionate family kinase [Phyllobacterium myrsinacearum]|uniref:Acetate kinase n=1 Tax=Phyllobacterium myrsinacearum TaxID=28101 RepID=A0A839ET32_9HYPH|nr:acetate/propionate family kinase [Phyllobacterium myrsinacearum]MBA8882089.1 acetate kinase [Phyllobacterium myrsinacearum]
MSDAILVFNAGSSSLKFAIFELDDTFRVHVRGSISSLDSNPRMRLAEGTDGQSSEIPVDSEGFDVKSAAGLVLSHLSGRGFLNAVKTIGHRIVHGGGEFEGATMLDDAVIAQLHKLIPLAPLHQPRNLEIVAEAAKALPEAKQYGCFDTAFHHSRPRIATLYGLPRELAGQGMVSYGFHGISYAYIASRLRENFGGDAGGRTIVAHLGSGASLCAMEKGSSVATTMGFSALDGLIMSTRCGSLDPGIVLHLLQDRGMSADDILELLYNKSGLLGVSGISGDMQTLLASKEPSAREAVDLFVYRAAQQMAVMASSLGGLDTLVFCAGIGEHSALIREKIAEATRWLGVEIDPARNARGDEDITASGSKVNVFTMATDEELAVAKEIRSLCTSAYFAACQTH